MIPQMPQFQVSPEELQAMQSQNQNPANTVAVNGQTAGTPYDYLAIQQKLAQSQRRGKIAEALAGQALQGPQGQMVGGYYVAPGLAGAAGQIAQAFLAKKGLDAQENAQLDATKEIASGRQGILDALFKNDPAAASQAIASGDPELLKLAIERSKQKKFEVIGSRAVDPNNPSKVLANYNDTPIGETMVDGDRYTIYQTPEGATYKKKLDNATKVSTQIYNAPQTKARDALRDSNQKRLDELAPVAREAPARLTQLAQAQELVKDGIPKGIGAPVQEFYGQILNTFGLEVPKGAQNIEAYRQRLLPNLLDVVRKLAPVTDTDRAFIARYDGFDPSKATDQDVIQLIQFAKDLSERDIQEYNRRAKVATKLGSQDSLTPEELQGVYGDIYPQISEPDLSNVGNFRQPPAPVANPADPLPNTSLDDLLREAARRGLQVQ